VPVTHGQLQAQRQGPGWRGSGGGEPRADPGLSAGREAEPAAAQPLVRCFACARQWSCWGRAGRTGWGLSMMWALKVTRSTVAPVICTRGRELAVLRGPGCCGQVSMTRSPDARRWSSWSGLTGPSCLRPRRNPGLQPEPVQPAHGEVRSQHRRGCAHRAVDRPTGRRLRLPGEMVTVRPVRGAAWRRPVILRRSALYPRHFKRSALAGGHLVK